MRAWLRAARYSPARRSTEIVLRQGAYPDMDLRTTAFHGFRDTLTRNAVVKLETLRDALRRTGYTRTQTPAPATTQRKTQRQTRTERVAAVRPETPRARVEQTIGRVVR